MTGKTKRSLYGPRVEADVKASMARAQRLDQLERDLAAVKETARVHGEELSKSRARVEELEDRATSVARDLGDLHDMSLTFSGQLRNMSNETLATAMKLALEAMSGRASDMRRKIGDAMNRLS